MRKRAFLLFGLLLWMGASGIKAAPGLVWERHEGTLGLRRGEQLLWRFNFGTNQAKPCFHPVAVAGGPVLTWYRPADHPWHHALWFAWKFINGVNYWEEDPKTGFVAGVTEWKTPRIETRPDFSSRIVLDLSYHPAKGQPVLTEQRIIEISPPDAQGIYFQDWTLTFTALGEDVKFDRTPLAHEPGGQPYGGYAGLSVRFAADLKDARAITSQGPIEFKDGRYRGKATAMDYSGRVEDFAAGIAILDHPQNLNAPSPWYAINDGVMRYFSPAVICYQPHTLKAGEKMTLRYRLIVHPESWDAERLQREWQRFSSTQPKP